MHSGILKQITHMEIFIMLKSQR